MIASASDGVATARCKDATDGTRAGKNRRALSKGWAPFVGSPVQGAAGLERALCLPASTCQRIERPMTWAHDFAPHRGPPTTLMGGREARSGARRPPTSSPRSAVPANRRHLPARRGGNRPCVVRLAADRLTSGMKDYERPSAEGLDLRPRRFRPWCLAVATLHSDNSIASNGRVAPQLTCPVVGRFHLWLPKALGSQLFLLPPVLEWWLGAKRRSDTQGSERGFASK